MKRKILTDVFEKRPTIPLYHYTNQSGLLGIINKREIWATHTQYLNDIREGLHALEIVREEIQALMKRRVSRQRLTILEEMDEDVCGLDGKGVRDVDGNVCVCSFSEIRDSLPQWRAYAPAVAGFAIGIPGQHLAKMVAKQQFYLARCIYDRTRQEALIRALIAEVADENTKRRTTTDKQDNYLPRGGNLHAYLHRYAPILKDPAFSEEREWRVISRVLSCTSPRFDYREGRSMLIPFYRFPLEDDGLPLQLHEVVVGPTPNPKQSARSVNSFLVRHHFAKVPVQNSTVPYRHW